VPHLAALEGDREMVALFCEKANADLLLRSLSLEDVRGHTPLLAALQAKQWQVLLDLLKRGGVPSAHRVDIDGRTLLHWAVVDNQAKAVQTLVSELGADMEARDPSGFTPLRLALRERSWDAARVLVDLGAKVRNKPFTSGLGFLTTAVKYAAPRDLLQKLVDRGAEIEAKDVRGWTPLFYATARGNNDALAALLDLGADPTVTDKMGHSALDVAIRRHRRPIIETLIRREDIECSQRGIDRAMGMAVTKGWWSLMDDIIGRGADVASKIHGARGWTPLMYAALRGQLEVASKLVEHGADVLAKNRRGRRARHFALEGGHKDTAKFLLKLEQEALERKKRNSWRKDVKKYSNTWERVSQYGWRGF